MQANQKIKLLQYSAFYLNNIQDTGVKIIFFVNRLCWPDGTEKAAYKNYAQYWVIGLPAFYHLLATV